MKKNNVIILLGLYLYSFFSIMGISGMSIAAGITILGIITSCLIDK
ncbi:MAG: hypothetical protein NZ928_07425 [Endomicrobia bacterium]|nr:hypothetical protein [Endomicrobiia bacterium]